MEASEFSYMQGFLLRTSGLVLNDDKRYLLNSRLTPLARQHFDGDMTALVKAVRLSESGELAKQVVDAMTTNETLFFRDQYPFDALKEIVVPEIQAARRVRPEMRIWSAAASRGQEAYSIAITLSELLPMAERHVRIYGTDISEEALAYARAGLYSQMEVQRGMPIQHLIRFFDQDGSHWRVKAGLQKMVMFESANLVTDTVSYQARAKGPFDVVFLRNVLIYFSPEERKRVIDRIAKAMQPGAYLITGAAEIPEGNLSRWESILFKGKRVWRLLP